MSNLMTSADVTRLRPVAVLPVGSHEQHGSHLPLATDTLIASLLAESIANHYQLVLLPPIAISCSHEHAAWPGTVSISSNTLQHIVKDIYASLQRSGIRSLAIVNAHGGNYVLSNVVQEANVSGPFMTLYPGRYEWEAARTTAGLESSMHEDMHGGELETSILLHAMPDAVRHGDNTDMVAEGRPHLLIHGLRKYTATGIVGRPSLATAEKGKAIVASLVSSFESHLSELS